MSSHEIRASSLAPGVLRLIKSAWMQLCAIYRFLLARCSVGLSVIERKSRIDIGRSIRPDFEASMPRNTSKKGYPLLIYYSGFQNSSHPPHWLFSPAQNSFAALFAIIPSQWWISIPDPNPYYLSPQPSPDLVRLGTGSPRA